MRSEVRMTCERVDIRWTLLHHVHRQMPPLTLRRRARSRLRAASAFLSARADNIETTTPIKTIVRQRVHLFALFTAHEQSYILNRKEPT